MATLTPEQQEQYFAEQGDAATPLSPTQWLAQQGGGDTPQISSDFLTPEQYADVQKAQQLVQNFEPTPIAADTLGQTTNTALPTTTTQEQTFNLESLTRDYLNQVTPAQEQLEAEQTSLTNELESLIQQTGTEAQRLGELEDELGVNRIQGQINEIDQQINQLVTQAKQAQVSSEGRQASGFAIKGEQAQIARELASQTFGLAAVREALTGNLALAQKQVERALDAEFGQLRANIDAKMFLLDSARDDLTAEQQKQAQLFEARVADYQRNLQLQQEERQAVFNLSLEAASLGNVPTSVLTQVQQASTQEEALAILAPYLNQETTSGGSTGGGATQDALSVNQIEQFRRSYGWTPPFGFTESQLIQFMQDNPGLTPEEYEALAGQAAGQVSSTGEPVAGATGSTELSYQSLFDVMKQAQRDGEDSEEIIQTVIDIYGLDALHEIAKEIGAASTFTSKQSDVERMLRAIV